MAVAFDSASAAQQFSGAASASWSHTASGSNRYVRVCVGWTSIDPAGTATATYGGSAMTSVGVITGVGGFTMHAQIFELINPPTGSQTVEVTFVTSNGFGAAGSISYTGVDQATASGTPVTTDGSAGFDTLTATVSSNAGDMIGDCLTINAGWSAGTLSGNRTERFQGDHSGSGGGFVGASQDTTTSGSVAMTWSWNTAVPCLMIAAKIIQASSATNRVTKMAGEWGGFAGQSGGFAG